MNIFCCKLQNIYRFINVKAGRSILPSNGTNSLGSKFRTGTNCLGNFGRPEHLAAGPSSLIHRVVLTVGICAVLLYLKLYLLFFKVIRSCRYWGVSLFIILNVSIAIVRIRLIFRDGNFDLAGSSSYVEWFSLYKNVYKF